MRTIFMIAICVSAAAPAFAQTRELSPYLACGADVAKQQYNSTKSIHQIQSIAVANCAPFLERNVKNSFAAVERDNGKILPQLRVEATERLRQKLRMGLLKIIEINVPAFRQASGR